MGIKERRDMEKTEMKQKIMDATIEIIESEGYEQLSIRKIAAKIEYSPTTIYLYYKDKAEIITDMSQRLYQKVMGAINAALDESSELSETVQIHHMLCIFIHELCSEPEMVKAILLSGANVIFADDKSGGMPSNPGIRLLDTYLLRGIANNRFKPDIAQTGWMLISALLGFVLSSISNQLHLQENFKQLADGFVSILLDGIKQ